MRDTAPIIVEETYGTATADVWKAITDLDEMLNWYFDTIESFEPVVGFETRFNVHAEGHDFMHLWKVTEVIPNKKIAYTFNYEGFAGDALVEWELTDLGNETKLRVTHTGLHTFPEDVEAFTRQSCEGGWKYFLGDRLKKHLASEH